MASSFESGTSDQPRNGEAVIAEISLAELNDKQIRGSLGSLLLSKSAWSCFSLSETSKLLRPLQICPDITGTNVIAQGATSEITYKFQMGNGRIGTMGGLISIEDFRGERLNRIYEQLKIPDLIPTFSEAIVVQIIDHLLPVFSREEDEELWQETILFTSQDLKHRNFLMRGLRLDAIPRSFLPHLQVVYEKIIDLSKDYPNVSFQVCLRAYLEYNQINNKELMARLISKYFYTLFRYGGIGKASQIAIRSLSFGLATVGAKRRSISRFLTLDNDSDTPLESQAWGQESSELNFDDDRDNWVSPEEFQRVRQDAESARIQADLANRIIAIRQEEEKQELIRKLSNPDKFLVFCVSQFFEGVYDSLPDIVGSDYGAVWVPRTSFLDENKRPEFSSHLQKITDQSYLERISNGEVSIIGYWNVLAESFYDMWILTQYKKLESLCANLEEIGVQVLDRHLFAEEVLIRFAARHAKIVRNNTSRIANLIVNSLAQRVAINTAQLSFQAMQSKLRSVLDMDISRNDMKQIRALIETFDEVFIGKREEMKSPYPIGTILATHEELNSWPKDSRILIGIEILNKLHREYLRNS